MRRYLFALSLLPLLVGCPPAKQPAVAQAPAPAPGAVQEEPVAAPGHDSGAVQETPVAAPNRAPADASESAEAKLADPVAEVTEPSPGSGKGARAKDAGGLGLLDQLGAGGVGIDEVDPTVGKARVKDRPEDRAPVARDPEPPPAPSPKREESKKPRKRTTGTGSIRVISNGERITYTGHLRLGQLTVVEYYADW